jgi:hypothetical protein
MELVRFKGVKIDKKTGSLSMKRSAKSMEITFKHNFPITQIKQFSLATV